MSVAVRQTTPVQRSPVIYIHTGNHVGLTWAWPLDTHRVCYMGLLVIVMFLDLDMGAELSILGRVAWVWYAWDCPTLLDCPYYSKQLSRVLICCLWQAWYSFYTRESFMPPRRSPSYWGIFCQFLIVPVLSSLLFFYNHCDWFRYFEHSFVKNLYEKKNIS